VASSTFFTQSTNLTIFFTHLASKCWYDVRRCWYCLVRNIAQNLFQKHLPKHQRKEMKKMKKMH